jgi:hypothetical protein
MNIRNACLGICFYAFQHAAVAQSNAYENPLNTPAIRPRPEMPEAVSNRIARRDSNFYFFKTMRRISTPSTIAFPFMSFTHNTYGVQKQPFVLDADIVTPIAIGGKRWAIGKWMHTVHIMPQFKVRIFQDDASVGDKSIPVRTPSTIPGIAYYGALRSWWDPHETGEGLNLLENFFLGLRVFHHSNGQDGPEYDPVNLGRINTYNGNFGEQVVFEFMMGGKTSSDDNINAFNSDCNKRKVNSNTPGKEIYLKVANRHEVFWKAGYELHPQKASSHAFDSLSIYGRHRLNLTAGLSLSPRLWEFIGDGTSWWDVVNESNYERWRFTLDVNYILDGDYRSGNTLNPESIAFFNAKKRLNLWVTAYWVMGSSQHAALFAQAGYYGSDNYNIYFNHSLWSFRFGIAFGFFDQPAVPDKQ